MIDLTFERREERRMDMAGEYQQIFYVPQFDASWDALTEVPWAELSEMERWGIEETARGALLNYLDKKGWLKLEIKDAANT